MPHQPASLQRPGQHHSSVTKETGDEAGDAATDVNKTVLPKQVIVKFASRRFKARVMEVKKDLKKLRNLDYPLYFQDDLTPKRAKLAYHVRRLKRNGKLSDTWVT